jgi:hypothetical protein
MTNEAPASHHLQTSPMAPTRPHWKLRCFGAFGALFATCAIALLAYAFIQDWINLATDQVPWGLLVMLFFVLALLWSGTVLVFRHSEFAHCVLVLSVAFGIPFTLFGLLLVFSD